MIMRGNVSDIPALFTTGIYIIGIGLSSALLLDTECRGILSFFGTFTFQFYELLAYVFKNGAANIKRRYGILQILSPYYH